jgi:hypothetical protein
VSPDYLTLIDSVSKKSSLEEGITAYGTQKKEYGSNIMKSATAIAKAAGCKDPKCCTCDEVKSWAAAIPEEQEDGFRDAIFGIASGTAK